MNVAGCPNPAGGAGRLRTSLVALALLFPAAALSQSITPNSQRLDLPDFAVPRATPGSVLPRLRLPERPDLEGMVGGLRIQVHDYRLTGNSVLEPEEIRRITAPFRDRAVSFADLQALREDLTRAYLERGYVTSGVLLPQQVVRDGTVEFQAVEGRLAEVEVQTDGRFSPEYFAARLRASAEPLVQLDRIEERLQLFQQDPRIQAIRAALRPTGTLGAAGLDVQVSEAPPQRGSVGIDNHSTPSVGASGLRLDYRHMNLRGQGDQLSTDLRLTEGLQELGAGYQAPLNARDTSLRLNLRVSRADVIDPYFSDLDIENDTLTYGIGLSHPLFRRLDQRMDLYAGLDLRRSDSKLLGEGFSFAEGPVDGVAELTVLRLGAEWYLRGGDQVTAARAQVSLGLDALGATVHDDGRPDGRFTSLLGQVQHVRRFPWRHARLILRGEFQLSDDRLLGLEQFSIGGHASVRGYRENQLVRDQGVVGSAETRVSVWNGPSDASFTDLALFVDAGTGRSNAGGEGPGSTSLASIGVGLLGTLFGDWTYELYWAHRLEPIDDQEESDLQDRGLHFALGYRWSG